MALTEEESLDALSQVLKSDEEVKAMTRSEARKYEGDRLNAIREAVDAAVAAGDTASRDEIGKAVEEIAKARQKKELDDPVKSATQPRDTRDYTKDARGEEADSPRNTITAEHAKGAEAQLKAGESFAIFSPKNIPGTDKPVDQAFMDAKAEAMSKELGKPVRAVEVEKGSGVFALMGEGVTPDEMNKRDAKGTVGIEEHKQAQAKAAEEALTPEQKFLRALEPAKEKAAGAAQNSMVEETFNKSAGKLKDKIDRRETQLMKKPNDKLKDDADKALERFEARTQKHGPRRLVQAVKNMRGGESAQDQLKEDMKNARDKYKERKQGVDSKLAGMKSARANVQAEVRDLVREDNKNSKEAAQDFDGIARNALTKAGIKLGEGMDGVSGDQLLKVRNTMAKAGYDVDLNKIQDAINAASPTAPSPAAKAPQPQTRQPVGASR